MVLNSILGVLMMVLSPQAAPSSASDAIPAPRIDGKPVEVTIGFYALDFARVTSREESFDVTGYLEMSWRDPSLARPDLAAGVLRPIKAGTIWVPKIFFENALEPPRFHTETVIEADDRGVVTSWSVVSGKFSSAMDLRRFPFDRQVLAVKIGSVLNDTIQRFRVNRDLIIVDEEAFVTDWTIGSPTADVDGHQYEPGRETYSRYRYAVPVERRSTFYAWRVMVPLSLLALVAWAAFWFEPVGLQPQISTCMAALIALVAFNFAIDFSLPKVAYLTLVDKHALIGFAFVAMSVAAVTAIHLAVTRNRLPLALTIQRSVRWIFLPAYAAAVAVNLL